MIWSVPSTFHVSSFSKQTNISFSHSFVQFFAKFFLLPTFMKKFIHFHFSSTLSSINIIYPWTHGRISIHITKYFVPCVKWYSSNILSMSTKYSKKHSPMFTCSCSHAHYSRSHTHKITSLVYLWSVCALLIIVNNNISSIVVLVVVAS